MAARRHDGQSEDGGRDVHRAHPDRHDGERRAASTLAHVLV
jgi:hypothetical protein